MAKTQWILLLSTCVVSAVSMILYIIAFLTDSWVVAEAYNADALSNSRLQYGLFGGSLTRHLLASESNYRLHIVCSYEDAACMYSCQLTHEKRNEELQSLLSGQTPNECPAIGRSVTGRQVSAAADGKRAVDARATDLTLNSVPPPFWLATVSLLGIGCVFALVTTAFAALNILYNPVEPIWGVLGLYIWNGIAAACAALTLIMWGALFAVRLTENVAVTDTLVPQAVYVSAGLATLGYSFWILIGPVLLHVLNCGLLVWRTRIIEAEPKQPTFIVEAKQDFTDMWF